MNKWVLVLEVLNENPGEEQVSVVLTRSYDFIDKFVKFKKIADVVLDTDISVKRHKFELA